MNNDEGAQACFHRLGFRFLDGGQAGCTGELSQPVDRTGACDLNLTAPSLRLLTNPEFDRTLAAALSIPVGNVTALVSETRTRGRFRSGTTGGLDAEQLGFFAQTVSKIASTTMKSHPELGECNGDPDKCLAEFLATSGKLLFRRSLTSDEKSELTSFLTQQMADGAGYSEAFADMLQVMLLSPQTLYRRETGVSAGGGFFQLDGISMASRLAFLIYGQGPGIDLIDAAEDGALVTAKDVKTMAHAMLEDPRAVVGITEFFRQWSGTDALIETHAETFGMSPELVGAMRDEVEVFVADALANDYTVAELFTETSGAISAELAQHYGVSSAASDWGNQPRSGLLTQAAWLTVSSEGQTIPTRRGDFVLEQMLCSPVASPPDEIVDMVVIPPPDPNATTRERFENHNQNSCTKGCHDAMDPIGYAFENFDAKGVYRTTENGKTIDASGELNRFDVGKFDNAKELMAQLGRSRRTTTCLTGRLLEYSLQSNEAHAIGTNRCEENEIVDALEAQGGTLRDLVAITVSSDAFRFSKTCSNR